MDEKSLACRPDVRASTTSTAAVETTRPMAMSQRDSRRRRRARRRALPSTVPASRPREPIDRGSTAPPGEASASRDAAWSCASGW